MSGPSEQPDRLGQHRVGTVLKGKYTLERVLGQGGMATVYLGVHRNGARVAVKVLHATLSAEAQIRARFIREGYVANRIAHAGVVRVQDDDVAEDGAAFLVMELLEGETLSERRARAGGKLSIRQTAAIGFALLDVLAAAHDKGVIHCDIKPENVFITMEGRLKVLDYGIARVRDGTAAATATLGPLGTPAYMAPEQVTGSSRDLSPQADIWACGATMFALASGTLVREGPSVGRMLVDAATVPARPLTTVAPLAGNEIAEVVDRALAFAVADRWPSARAMQSALEAAFETKFGEALSGVAIDPPPGASTTEERSAPRTGPASAASRPHRQWTGWAVAAGLASFGITVFALTSRHPKDGASAPAPSAQPAATACTTNGDCARDAAVGTVVCRKDVGRCVDLTIPGCTILAEPSTVADDSTIWFGAMFPTTGVDDDLGNRSLAAIDLARRDFMEVSNGLPPTRAGAHARPIGVVACDDATEPTRMAEHLVSSVGVPVVIGFYRSKEVMDLAISTFNPKGVLALANNTASMLTSVPVGPDGQRLVWRTTTSSTMDLPAIAAVVEQVVEPAVRAGRDAAAARKPVRLAHVHVDNMSGIGQADTFVKLVRINGKSVVEGGEWFRSFAYRDTAAGSPAKPGSDDPEAIDAVSARVAAFRPDIVVTSQEEIFTIERQWPRDSTPRPRYVSMEPMESPGPELTDELAARVLWVDVPTARAPTAKYLQRHHASGRAIGAQPAPYDAFYVAAYAAAAIGDRPITGVDMARALRRLVPPGDPIDVGPADIYRASATLARGGNIDLAGAMTTLDFDAATGEASVDLAVVCYSTSAESRGPRETGAVFYATSGKLVGKPHCP